MNIVAVALLGMTWAASGEEAEIATAPDASVTVTSQSEPTTPTGSSRARGDPPDGAAARPIAPPPASQGSGRPGERPPAARATRAGLVLELRSEFGFERLLMFELANGRRVSLHANDGLGFSAGMSFLPLAGGRLATRASAGFKVGRLRAENGTALFTAFPLDLMEAAYVGPLRVGVGVSLLLAPRLRGDGIVEHAGVRFAPAPGAIADVEWILSPRARTGVGLRASWHRFAVGDSAEGAPAVGLVIRSDLDLTRGSSDVR